MNASLNAKDPASDPESQNWIGLPKHLGFGISSNCDSSLGNRKVGGIRCYVIVIQHTGWAEGSTDCVWTASYSLTSSPGIGRNHIVSGKEADKRTRQCWVNITIGLAGCIRGDRGRFSINSEVSSVIGDVVICQHFRWTEDRANHIWATNYRLANRTAVGCSYPVSG